MRKSRKFSDEELVIAIQSRDKIDEAIRFIYSEHFRFLEKVVTGNMGSTIDSEDIFQEVLITFIDMVHKQKFRGDAKVRTVLYSLTRNIWISELRKRNRSQMREEKFYDGLEKVEKGVVDHLAIRESNKEVYTFLDSLGESCKKLLVQFYYLGMSMKSILSEYGYENEQVLRNKKYKCMKKLVDIINDSPLLKQRLKSALQNG